MLAYYNSDHISDTLASFHFRYTREKCEKAFTRQALKGYCSEFFISYYEAILFVYT